MKHPQRQQQVEIVYYPKKARGPVPKRLQTVETQVTEEIEAFTERSSSEKASSARSEKAERSEKPERASRKSRRTLTDETAPPLDRDPTEQAFVDLTRLGHQAFEAGRAEEARVVFEALVALGHRDPFAHTMLGTILLGAHALDRALEQFEAALQIDPEDLAALVYRGEIRLSRRGSKGAVARAVEDLERAVELGPSSDPFVARAKKLLSLARANRTA